MHVRAALIYTGLACDAFSAVWGVTLGSCKTTAQRYSPSLNWCLLLCIYYGKINCLLMTSSYFYSTAILQIRDQLHMCSTVWTGCVWTEALLRAAFAPQCREIDGGIPGPTGPSESINLLIKTYPIKIQCDFLATLGLNWFKAMNILIMYWFD